MSEATLKQRIRAYIDQTDHVSFAELGNRFGEEFRGGNQALTKGETLILWDGMTDAGSAAVAELLDEGAIHPVPSSYLVYLLDGAAMKLPIQKQARPCKTPHWLPVTLRPGPAPKARSRNKSLANPE